MERIQDIFDNKDNHAYDRIIFISDTPVFGVKGVDNAEIGGKFNTKELLKLMKTSIPPEPLKGISWAKKVKYNDEEYSFLLELTEDKRVRIEVIKHNRDRIKEVEEITEVDPKIIDELLEADALIYYSAVEKPNELINVVIDSGYSVKFSRDKHAVKQAINYKAFSLLVLNIHGDFKEDSVVKELKAMQMDARRNQFTLLVTDRIKTGDGELAFSHSVSMVLNSNEIAEFEALFPKINENIKRTSSTFIEILENKV